MPVFNPEIHNQPGRPRAAPIELAGQWVAWDKDEQHILANAVTLPELRDAVRSLGSPKVIYQHVPRPNRLYSGLR